jgi:hypothetical protein
LSGEGTGGVNEKQLRESPRRGMDLEGRVRQKVLLRKKHEIKRKEHFIMRYKLRRKEGYSRRGKKKPEKKARKVRSTKTSSLWVFPSGREGAAGFSSFFSSFFSLLGV